MKIELICWGLAKSAAPPFAGSGTNKLSFIIFAFLALEGQNFTENNKVPN